MDIHEILRHLPHRYPIILVDRVLELERGKRIAAIKNVSANEPVFMGHFPHYPVMPGVLIIEALAQAAAILSFVTFEKRADENSVYYFAGIDNARFKRPVGPGDQLRLEVELVREMRGIGKFSARALVDGQIAAEADLLCAYRQIPASAAFGGNGNSMRVVGRSLMARAHPAALVDPAAELADDVEVGPYVSSVRTFASAPARRSAPMPCCRAARRSAAATASFRMPCHRRHSAGQEVRRRGHRTGDRRRQYDPRVLHLQCRHRPGRRRHPRRIRQLGHGLRARGPRLPYRRSLHPGQWRHARRPRRRRRLGDSRRTDGSAPVRPHRQPRDGRRRHDTASRTCPRS
jgi:3-hydroxyacyl-[acyl-carrier-protein] dehydratase